MDWGFGRGQVYRRLGDGRLFRRRRYPHRRLGHVDRGLGRNATVGRMPIASATSSATTAVMETTANAVPTSRKGRRPRPTRDARLAMRLCYVEPRTDAAGPTASPPRLILCP
jgi:hypothetical protein